MIPSIAMLSYLKLFKADSTSLTNLCQDVLFSTVLPSRFNLNLPMLCITVKLENSSLNLFSSFLLLSR